MKTFIFLKNNRGFVLIAVYLVISVISILAFAFYARGNSFLQAAERNQNRIVAFSMAEAAIDATLVQLVSNPGYTGTTSYTSLSTNFVQGGYTVTVTTPPDNANIRIIQATGFSPNNNVSSRAYQTATITVYGQLHAGHLFDYAIFAEDGIHLALSGNAAHVDSYDSRDGAYDPSNTGTEGNIGTNSTSNGSVFISANSVIDGNITVGPGGDPASVITIGGNAQINGTVGAATEKKIYPLPTTDLTSSGSLTVAGNNTYNLPSGTYYFDSISITGSGKLNITGPATIYVRDSIEIGGNGIGTQNNLPPNLLLYFMGSADVQITGNGNLYAGIYAPGAHVKNSGNGSIFGAVVGKTYQQGGNGSTHFDEALKEVQGNIVIDHVSVAAWGEQNSLSWGT